MLPIHTILFPTDFSDHSDNALHLAVAVARDYAARLIVLHVALPPTIIYGEGVVPPDPDTYFAEGRVKLRRLTIPADIGAVERRFVEGDPATEILRAVRDSGIDLVVMGTHGRTGLSRLLMGSVAEKTVRRALCPVLTVRMPFPAAVTERAAEPELSLAGGI
jgi:nucleotide-binding universal stress UspA family protein